MTTKPSDPQFSSADPKPHPADRAVLDALRRSADSTKNSPQRSAARAGLKKVGEEQVRQALCD